MKHKTLVPGLCLSAPRRDKFFSSVPTLLNSLIISRNNSSSFPLSCQTSVRPSMITNFESSTSGKVESLLSIISTDECFQASAALLQFILRFHFGFASAMESKIFTFHKDCFFGIIKIHLRRHVQACRKDRESSVKAHRVLIILMLQSGTHEGMR
jgi:hypothetical protein